MTPRLRCAIYTRKSSDEGLEQDFNSLDAQREACSAYIRSQTQAGWVLLPQHFDDGGYSGGTLDRPALQVLLAAVDAHQIDVIVVYKIDRLSRSLADFAKLAERFDARGVSFVSVTQPFNTTTSMGRLVLHVLLSFAQFEREVTAERIRDKLAMSKRKGLWMGGYVPLGYRAQERTLVIDPDEAAVVRTLYQLFQAHGSIRVVQAEARRLNLTTKRRLGRDGRMQGGRPFSRGHLYRLLTSPIYAGRIPHKDTSYPGQHPALIDEPTWEDVQQRLGGRRRRLPLAVASPPGHRLQGLVRDSGGARFRTTQTFKSGRRYRYYTHPDVVEGAPARSLPNGRWPAASLEQQVVRSLGEFLRCRRSLVDALAEIPITDWDVTAGRAARLADVLESSTADGDEVLRRLIAGMVISDEGGELRLSRVALYAALAGPSDATPGPLPDLVLPLPLPRRPGRARWILDPPRTDGRRTGDPGLVRTLARAQTWWDRLVRGEDASIEALARREGVSPSLVTRIVRLAFLAPDIAAAILRGQQPPGLTARQLMNGPPPPLAWRAQREQLGFPARPAP